ncbi:MAG: hypothetical protein UT64_C0057G0011, partial [Candidatus Falkowbacteria bacterium GW2011_GWF2_39_8]
MFITLFLSIIYFNISFNLDNKVVNFVAPDLSENLNAKIESWSGVAKKIVVAHQADATIGDIDFARNLLLQRRTPPAEAVVLPVAAPKLPLKNSTSTEEFSTSANGGFVMDVVDGTVLFEKNADQ